MTAQVQKSTKILQFYNGQKIPAVGLGTWRSTEKEVYDAVLNALKIGYRHIDTAAMYGNEVPIGEAIKASGIPRQELFITTKIWGTDHQRAEKALDKSLKNLQLDYIDLYLIHWPVPLNPNGNDPYIPLLPDGKRDIILDGSWDFIKTWELLQKLPETGKVKSIGVSNFSITNLEKLLNSPTTIIKPVVNQVELHPFLPQHNLLKYAKEHDILLEAYSPLGSNDSPILSDEVIVKIAERNNVSPASVLISWALWRGTVVLPKSVTKSRIESNFNVFELSDSDGEEINNLHKLRGIQRLVLPNWSPVVVFDSDE